jgi:hypothetical protein
MLQPAQRTLHPLQRVARPPLRAPLVLQASMSTPIITARRNLAQRIANLLRKAGGGELSLTPWQLSRMRDAIEQLKEERFAEGERTMSEAERRDLYEPAGYVAAEPIEGRHLVEQLAAVVAAE